MLNFPQDRKYKIEFVDGKGSFIASDHKSKTLYISKDLKLNTTDDGKLRVTFPNFRPKPSGGFGCSSSYRPETDCSVTISDPSVFNYCIQNTGEYRLSGSNISFEGTDALDRLVLNECLNAKIDLGKGDDTVKIESQDRPIIFQNNKIKTGKGDDKVIVSGDFIDFSRNEFYLGSGSDTFSAKINPKDDLPTHEDFQRNIARYGNPVRKNEIYAIDGYTGNGDKKGWFEKNNFEAKTYAANELFKYISGGDNNIDGFDTYKYKETFVQSKTESYSVKSVNKDDEQSKKTSYREKHEQAQKRYQINSLLYNLTGKPEFAEGIFEASKEAVDACR